MNGAASGSERGLLKQLLDGATLATARGTDPAIPYTQLKTDLGSPSAQAGRRFENTLNDSPSGDFFQVCRVKIQKKRKQV